MDTAQPQLSPVTVSQSRRSCSVMLLACLLSLLGVIIILQLARIENDYGPTGYSCRFNLKQLGLVFRMYADEHDGVFPELSPKPGVLAIRQDQAYPGIFPEYISDLTVFRCPNVNLGRPRERWFWEDPPPPPLPLDSASNDESYFYLGYFIPDQATLEQFATTYRAHVGDGKFFDEDLVVASDEGAPAAIPRLRDNTPGITDTDEGLSAMPVFIERYPSGHVPDGGNVLYADGHVEFIKWGTKWPMTPEAMEVLLALDGLGDTPTPPD